MQWSQRVVNPEDMSEKARQWRWCRRCGAVQIPAIAAGGIADGRGIAAAFTLGAKAVQMGTRFIATQEAQVHESYRNQVLRAKDIDTRVTGRSTGHPVRALRNEMTKRYLELEQEGASFEELEQLTLGGLRRAVVEGDVRMGSMMAGRCAGLVREILPCSELVPQLMQEAKACMKGIRIDE